MIHVRYSNRIEKLVELLAGALPRPGDVDAMFDGPWLVIPERPLELYVDLELARRRGISAHFDTLSISGTFARLCARALPDVVLVQRGHMVAELLALFAGKVVEDDQACAELHSYLLAAGESPDAVDRRRVDLADALGRLFDDWSLSKPELLASWRAGEPGAVAAGSALGRAERALWGALFDKGGRFERRGASEEKRYLTLDSILAQRLDAAWQPPAEVHVFGLSQLSRGLQLALARLGERTELFVYAVNPCREFWEDVETQARRTVQPGGGKTRRRGSAAKVETRQLELAGLAGVPRVPSAAAPAAATTAATATAGAGVLHELVAEQSPGTASVDNAMLRAWGHAGRESTRLLSQLSDGDFEASFVAPAQRQAQTDGRVAPVRPTTRGAERGNAVSLLAHVQQDILDRRPARGGESALNLRADGSLVLLGAPNPRRELETIAADIWRLVRADARAAGVDEAAETGTPHAGPDGATASGAAGSAAPPLRFSDVAVLIAGPDEPYLSLARAVFREAQELPHSVVDQPIASSSRLGEALLALLSLPLGNFTRREVLDVITHPNLLATVRARFPDADPQTWLKLCEGLGIAHGADRAALADTYIDGDVFNWDQGCKRLALGLFARGPRSAAATPVSLPGGEDGEDGEDGYGYLPAEVSADVRPDAQALALLVRSLLADARFARSARMAVPEWMRFVRALLGTYLMGVTPEDELARLRVFGALDQIAAEAPGAAELTLTLAPVVELVRRTLSGLRGSRGQILGAGVTVGTLGTLRSLPFRVIYVAGLGAERFPAADRQSPLDLDPDRQRPGDVTPRQQDRYLFLETLLAPRERLVLSHVDRDALTGEVRQPSSVVLELADQLRGGYLAPGTSLARSVPLHRDEDLDLHAAFPAAAREAQVRALGNSLQAEVPAVAGLASARILSAFSPAVRASLGSLLRTITVEATAPVTTGGRTANRPSRRVLQLADLRRFLECPLQGSARIFLGLRDLPDDTEARETADEPFEVPRWLERSLLGDVFAGAWREGTLPGLHSLAAAYDEGVARHREGRVLPAGLFGANVRRRHLRVLEQWGRSLAASQSAARGPVGRVCFGRPDPFAFAVAGERRDPILVEVPLPGGGTTVVEIHGTTEPQFAPGGSLVLSTSPDREKNDKDSLRAFLDHVLLAASRSGAGAPADAPLAGAICRPSRDAGVAPLCPVSFYPLDVERARRYLTDLASELLSGVHSYLFPCEAVFRSWDDQMTLVDRIDQVRADRYYREHSSSKWGPVPDPYDYPTPAAELADRYATSRFGLLRNERVELRARGRSSSGKGESGGSATASEKDDKSQDARKSNGVGDGDGDGDGNPASSSKSKRRVN